MDNRPAVLTFEDVHKGFISGRSVVQAVRGITLSVGAGETVALVGPSGSGKSTLLSLGAGLELPDTGRVLLDGVNLNELDEDGRAVARNKTLGFVYQNFQLLPAYKAIENVTLPLELLGGVSYSEILDRARHLLEQVGLADRVEHYPAQLSGGEQQRVAIARALVTKPKLILADEPTGNLDRANADTVMSLVRELCSQNGTAVVLVTHDEEVANQMERRVGVRDGVLS